MLHQDHSTGRVEDLQKRRSAALFLFCDSYDNALAESVIGLYKTELVRRKEHWKTIDDLELATLG